MARLRAGGIPSTGFRLRPRSADAAYASAEETLKGTLTVGKLADFAVLSDDIFSIAPSRLHGVKVVLTVMGGRRTFESPAFSAAPR